MATAETTTSQTYVALATPGPAVTATVPASGKVFVTITSTSFPNANDRNCATSYALSGANTQAATDARSVYLGRSSGDFSRASTTTLLTGLTPGSTTFTAQYKVGQAGTATCTFQDRTITVLPWPN